MAEAGKEVPEGIYIRFRTDGKLLNLRRMTANTLVLEQLVREALFADDAALAVHSKEDLQLVIDRVSMATKRFGLTISIKKTEVMFQPAPNTIYEAPSIQIDNVELKVVDFFKYLGSILANDCSFDQEISHRIKQAASAFGKLYSRLWNKEGITLKTKLKVYRAVVLTTLLYGAESWVLYRRLIGQLNSFHLRCLRTLLRIVWQDYVPNTEVLERASMTGIEAILIRTQLRWAGHVSRMPDTRLPKQMLYGELKLGKRRQGAPRLRFKDKLKRNLQSCEIDWKTWEEQAQDRSAWRTKIYTGAKHFERERITVLQAKRARRKRGRPPGANNLQCNLCGTHFYSISGLKSHIRAHERRAAKEEARRRRRRPP
jgi:hypothetical protein